MNETIKVNVSKYIVMHAEGEQCSAKFETLLNFRQSMWEQTPTEFAFFCKDWMKTQGCKVELSVNEDIGWLERAVMRLLLSVAVRSGGE